LHGKWEGGKWVGGGMATVHVRCYDGDNMNGR
jgi:hypothetical protein